MDLGTDTYQWTIFYTEFANKLLAFRDNRRKLLSIFKDIHKDLNIKYPFARNGKDLNDVCPFSVFGCFNKGISDSTRISILREIKEKFVVTAEVPTQFDGIPVLNNLFAWMFADEDDERRKVDDIDNLWHIFAAAIDFADTPSDTTKNGFITAYESVRKQFGVKWNLTMGLFWIRPYAYLNLDGKNRAILSNSGNAFFEDLVNVTNFKEVPDANTYLTVISICTSKFLRKDSQFHSFPELSHAAWLQRKKSPELEPVNREVHYWIITPGDGSTKAWEDCHANGTLSINSLWDNLGDLTQYPSKTSIKEKMPQLLGKQAGSSYKNHALAVWQFAHEIKPGDVIFVKMSPTKIVGRGIVESDYIFEDSRQKNQHLHKINWTHKGEWDCPERAANKQLTDISPYTEYLEKLSALFDTGEPFLPKTPDTLSDKLLPPPLPIYTEDEFLDEVFMDENSYRTLVQLLRRKKNIILQGAPGVGKTFISKRLAYAMMGKIDRERVMLVQFHQSYSYEDFILGYRPEKNGFELKTGPFYDFCKNASEDDENDYFFIIDEINRGNLSKIFGELLMLIESDKRGEKLRLLYSNELFSVPKNVYIIGLMNTADRSLALIDYALRRRFAFFDLEPAFDAEGFKTIMAIKDDPKFFSLVETVKQLNEAISRDETLGNGFKIGHSYLCPGEDVTDDWLNTIVKHEILPLLHEYWFDDPEKVQEWEKRLKGAIK